MPDPVDLAGPFRVGRKTEQLAAFSEGGFDMVSNALISNESRSNEDPKTAVRELKPVAERVYHAPELHDLGTVRQVQGRNFYSDRDLGNSNYFI